MPTATQRARRQSGARPVTSPDPIDGASTTAPGAAEAASPQPQAPAKETPKARPEAELNMGEVAVPVWKPTAVLNGVTIECPHKRYGHESAKAARACISTEVAKAGGKLPAAK
jgi:hypothetical protein